VSAIFPLAAVHLIFLVYLFKSSLKHTHALLGFDFKPSMSVLPNRPAFDINTPTILIVVSSERGVNICTFFLWK